MLSYEVYANKLISANDFETLKTVSEQEIDSLILLTCENEAINGEYLNRRVIFAKPR